MKKLKILAVGGGSGGHVTPVVAVLRELHVTVPNAEVRFWCDKSFYPQAKTIMAGFDETVPVQAVVSGKLRRYQHLKWWQHVTIPSVFWPNLRDILLVAIGVVQSCYRLIRWRPDVVFTKGGYVCLPVGWAARLLHIPLVIHDSDAHPGLTNRLLARHATLIGTGAPLEYYPYPVEKSCYVGIPIGQDFAPFTADRRQSVKRALGFSGDRPLTVVTGGGLGARRINDATVLHLEALLAFTDVLLISGTAQYDELRALTPADDAHFKLEAFISSGMADVLGAADVVVTRAGATTLLELAALHKPIVLVPNARLTGGHQTKNAKVYADAGAAILVDDDALETTKSDTLVDAVKTVVEDVQLQHKMSVAIAKLARPHAARDMADMIVEAARQK